jgi:hypothetical protein
MATWLGNFVSISGGLGARIRIETQLAGQNYGGNYSTINYQVYIDFNGSDAQLDGGWVQSSAGVHYNNGGRVYNYAGNFSNHTILMNNGSFNIGHDGAGNGSYGMNAHVAVYQSGTTTASGSEGLPTIPRYASITAFYIDNVTDTSFRFNWNSSDNVDYISWWSSAYDGGGHHDTPAGGTGTFSITLSSLPSERTFDVAVAVRRADSGLWTSSGTLYAVTGSQNGFFDTMGL